MVDESHSHLPMEVLLELELGYAVPMDYAEADMSDLLLEAPNWPAVEQRQ